VHSRRALLLHFQVSSGLVSGVGDAGQAAGAGGPLRLVIVAAWCSVVLLRLGYLTVSNVFAVLRLLPMSDRDKEGEILALRHQTAVLERQLGRQKVRFTRVTGHSWRRCCTGCRRRCASSAAAGAPGHGAALAP
jgi:hypothetical protein